MYKSGSDSGYDFDDQRRFEVLKSLKFSSLLDVGSGPCLLKNWLQAHGKECVYEAVDIRKEALELCDCTSYTSIPKNKYDVVCLLGTCGLRSERDGKKELLDLLINSKSICGKYLVFSVILNRNNPRIVSYSSEELIELISKLDLTYKTLVDEKNSECIVVCSI
jgi:hypothetical protein